MVIRNASADAEGPGAAELIGYCRDRLPHLQCPKAVEFVAELPRGDNGKLYRRLLISPID